MGVWRFPVSAPTPTSYTRPDPAKKAAKPYKDFPLFLHQTGEYAKKVRGRMHYSGVDREAALAKWLKEKDHLLAGRTPPRDIDQLTLRDLANLFLNSKKIPR